MASSGSSVSPIVFDIPSGWKWPPGLEIIYPMDGPFLINDETVRDIEQSLLVGREEPHKADLPTEAK
jgi:hypothetical protein